MGLRVSIGLCSSEPIRFAEEGKCTWSQISFLFLLQINDVCHKVSGQYTKSNKQCKVDGFEDKPKCLSEL